MTAPAAGSNPNPGLTSRTEPGGTSSGTNTDASTGSTFDAGVMLGAGVVVLLLVLAVVFVIGRSATRARQRDRAAGRIVGNETVRGEAPGGRSGTL